jgi:predicted XRE-type DNA-binding protein
MRIDAEGLAKRNAAMNDQVIESTGNVFEDICVAEPDVALAKADLALAIAEVIGERGWTQEEAAAVLGIDQPKVSLLMRGRLSGFSFERLMRLLNRLNYDVQVTIREAQSDTPHTAVVVEKATSTTLW